MYEDMKTARLFYSLYFTVVLLLYKVAAVLYRVTLKLVRSSHDKLLADSRLLLYSTLK